MKEISPIFHPAALIQEHFSCTLEVNGEEGGNLTGCFQTTSSGLMWLRPGALSLTEKNEKLQARESLVPLLLSGSAEAGGVESAITLRRSLDSSLSPWTILSFTVSLSCMFLVGTWREQWQTPFKQGLWVRISPQVVHTFWCDATVLVFTQHST